MELELIDGVEPLDGDGEDSTEAPVLLLKEGGQIYAVFLNGVQVRAILRDYDIEYPCPALLLEQDEDGDNFMEMLI